MILEAGSREESFLSLILDEVQEHRATHINFVQLCSDCFWSRLIQKENMTKLESLKWIFKRAGEAVTSDIVQNLILLGPISGWKMFTVS